MLSVDVISAVQHSPTHTQMTFQFRVLPEYLNPGGTLHGAGQSLFFDACTTMLLGPIARPPEFWTTYGTSRSLNVVYFRPAFEGDLLTLECEVWLFSCMTLKLRCLVLMVLADGQCFETPGFAEGGAKEAGWSSYFVVRTSDV